MSNSAQLRKNKNQHIVKNIDSKKDDKIIESASNKVIDYLKNRFKKRLYDYEIIYKKEIKVSEMINFIKRMKVRKEFALDFNENKIKPDGGSIFLKNKKTNELFPLLISETKKQGTNKQRMKEGKKRQATGNAIERLGKNLIGIKAMLNHYDITPFICFGWGDDFAPEVKTVLVKILILNEFYPLNRISVFKRDGTSDFNKYSPVSMFFREKQWNEEEMFEIMKEIAETSLRYYIF